MNAVWLTVTGSPLLRSFPPAPLPRCGRGVVHERGMVDSHRIAPAPLIPPLPRPQRGRGRGARGEGEGGQLLATVPRTILEMLVTTVKSLKPSQTYSGAEGEYAILS
jgi:hypothetical protein